MAKARGHRPLLVLRWTFLLLLVAFVVVVARLYLSGQTEPEAPPRIGSDLRPEGEPGLDVVLAGEGFEYEATEDGKTLFFIRSDRMLSDSQDHYVLEGVTLSMGQAEGYGYLIQSRRATYDLNTREASLEGEVVLAGPDGIELSGEGFEVRQRGRVLVSTVTPARFRLSGGYEGRARAARINLRQRIVVLSGGVVVVSPPGMEPTMGLEAGRVAFNRGEGVLRATGGVVLNRGEDQFRSRRLSATLNEDERIRFIRGQWDVSGRIAQTAASDRDSRVEFSAQKLALLYDDAGAEAETAELEGTPATPVELRLEDGTGRRRTLRSARLTASFTGGSVSRLETFQPVVLEEALARTAAAPLRRLCGDSLVATLDAGGELDELELDGGVDYQDASLSASGERLTSRSDDEMRLAGSPVWLLSDRGEIQAPEIVYSPADGSVRATGGVLATAQEQSGVGFAVGGGGEDLPVRVTAREAVWTEQPGRVVFEGEVKAYQAESYVLADRLSAPDDGSSLEAEGAVKTYWKPPPESADQRPPVEVNAERLVWARSERMLNYSQSVRVHEAGRTLRCDDLDLGLDEDDKMRTFLCQGSAVVDDPVSGRLVRGKEALYTPDDHTVLISGEPVVLRDRDGAEIRGRRLRYDLESGEAQILSEPRVAEQEPTDDAPADNG